MSTVAPTVEPADPRERSGLAAIIEHARYVLGENKVTGFAFAAVRHLLAALSGPMSCRTIRWRRTPRWR